MFLTPRQTFQRLNKEELKSLTILLSESWFKQCLIAAMAEMNAKLIHLSPDMTLVGNSIRGANTFLDTLSSLTVEDTRLKDIEASPKLPSYDPAYLDEIRKQAMKDLQAPVTQK